MALFTYKLQQNNGLHLHISKPNITGSKNFRSDYLVQPPYITEKLVQRS